MVGWWITVTFGPKMTVLGWEVWGGKKVMMLTQMTLGTLCLHRHDGGRAGGNVLDGAGDSCLSL